jgi:hypothetical protein
VLRALRLRRNLAALTWHHRDPRGKGFELDVRAFSNRTPETIELESAKCDLLCANCHAEVHFPQLDQGAASSS